MRGKVLLGIIFFPIAAVFLVTVGELFFHVIVRDQFWKDESFLFFFMGAVGWFTLAFFKMQPALAYVFAHEMSHVIATWLSFGKIRKMEIGEGGGFVVATKSNWFITLAPYLMPLYMLLVFALQGCADVIFGGLDREFQLPLYFWHPTFNFMWVFYFWVGMTWAFHAQFTFDVLLIEQSDLTENGEFFSLMLIFMTNLAILGGLFIAASPTVTMGGVLSDAWGSVVGAIQFAKDFITFACRAVT